VSPPLALVDFAVSASSRELRFAFLEGCRLKLINEHDIEHGFNLVVRRRGAKKLRPLLALWVPELNRIRSVLEGLFLLAWVARGYPMPLVNVRIHGKEVDFYWPNKRFVLETDGSSFHSDPIQKAIDFAKQKLLESRGETLIRMTYRQFEDDPSAQVHRVASQLGYA